jgi:hypothetical protein
MCGRARLSSDVSEIKIAFGIPPERPTPNIAPSWNLAPTDPAPVVYYDAKDGGRRLEVMRRGLIPYWAKDIKIGFSTINARAEEVDTKPAFREVFQRRGEAAVLLLRGAIARKRIRGADAIMLPPRAFLVSSNQASEASPIDAPSRSIVSARPASLSPCEVRAAHARPIFLRILRARGS